MNFLFSQQKKKKNECSKKYLLILIDLFRKNYVHSKLCKLFSFQFS